MSTGLKLLLVFGIFVAGVTTLAVFTASSPTPSSTPGASFPDLTSAPAELPSPSPSAVPTLEPYTGRSYAGGGVTQAQATPTATPIRTFPPDTPSVDSTCAPDDDHAYCDDNFPFPSDSTSAPADTSVP